ncbi:MAG: hypothetical protein M1570_17795 [Chloroflexi bacterium]|nr:hypothetical protein [Chloroflexota bacterium]
MLKFSAITVALLVLLVVLSRPPAPVRAQSGDVVSTAMLPEPKLIQAERLAHPPKLSLDQVNRLSVLRDLTHRTGPSTPGATRAPRAEVSLPPPTTPQPLPTANLSSDFAVFEDTDVCAGAAACSAGVVAEPSAVNSGMYVLETYNWYAAVSSDGGSTFTYVNPQTLLPPNPSYGVFCCDQSVVYDPHRNLFIWVLLSMNSSGGNYYPNVLRLLVARGQQALAGLTFYSYDLVPAQQNLPAADWFDYPSLGLSDNDLYLSTNLFNTRAAFDQTVVFRLPLDALATHTTAKYPVFPLPNVPPNDYFNATFTQGATNAMYFATHVTTSTVHIYRWSESAGAPDAMWDISHTAYPDAVPTNYSCPITGGGDFCKRSDDRILSGWISNGMIGFLWDAPKGSGGFGTFAYPYVQSVLINASNMTFAGEPIMYNPSYAFEYAAAGLNGRGHVAGPVFYGGGTVYPTLAAFIWDDLSSPPYSVTAPTAAFESYTIIASTNPPYPGVDTWGDFLSAHQNLASSFSANTWIGSGYTLSGGGGDVNSRPRYLVFGRRRDDPTALIAMPSSVTVQRTPGSSASSPFTLNLWNGGTATAINWTATAPVSVTLSTTNMGTLAPSATLGGTVAPTSYMTGTYSLGSIALTGVRADRQPLTGASQSLPVNLYVGSLFYFPLIFR